MTYQGRRREFKSPIFCVSEPLSLSVLKGCAAQRGLIFVKRLILLSKPINGLHVMVFHPTSTP